VDELLTAVTHKSKPQIERLLAARFPKADVPAEIHELPTGSAGPISEAPQLFPERVFDEGLMFPGGDSAASAAVTGPTVAPAEPSVTTSSPLTPADRPRVRPLSAKSFAVQFTIDEATHDLLREAQDLLGHQVAPGDLAVVFGRALEC